MKSQAKKLTSQADKFIKWDKEIKLNNLQVQLYNLKFTRGRIKYAMSALENNTERLKAKNLELKVWIDYHAKRGGLERVKTLQKEVRYNERLISDKYADRRNQTSLTSLGKQLEVVEKKIIETEAMIKIINAL